VDLVRRWQAQWLCCPRSSNRPAPPERRTTLVGQPVGEEVIAKKENKIQIFRSHNCILGLGLDPVVAESSKPAHPGLGPGPRSPGRSPSGSSSPRRLRDCGAAAPGIGRETGASPRPCAGTAGGKAWGTPGIAVPPSLPSGMSQVLPDERAERYAGAAPHRVANSLIPRRTMGRGIAPCASPRRAGGRRGGCESTAHKASARTRLRVDAPTRSKQGCYPPTQHQLTRGGPGSPATLSQPWDGAGRASALPG